MSVTLTDYDRTGVPAGKVVNLYITFYDSLGNPLTLDAVPTLYIFDPDGDTDDNGTAITSVTPTELAAGLYVYNYTIPSTPTAGTWSDKWVATAGSSSIAIVQQFVVVEYSAGLTTDSQLFNNNMVKIVLDSTVADTDGNTLGSDYEFYYTTAYDPLYVSSRVVRLDIGFYLTNVPDDTINLAIFEASREAVVLTFPASRENITFYNYARQQYVTCVAEERLLWNLVDSAAKAKRLADLDVTIGGNYKELLEKLHACKQNWRHVLVSGGARSPDTGLAPDYGVRTYTDADRPIFGRGIYPVNAQASEHYPAANTVKIKKSTERRWTSTFKKGMGKWRW